MNTHARRLAVTLSWLLSTPLVAATFTVVNTNDSGPGSLRQAILNANIAADADTIAFVIPGTGVHTITPTTALPQITYPVTIDGYTQPGASQNTQLTSDDAVLLIEINGDFAGTDSDGIVLNSASTVRGLVVNRFRRNVVVSPGLVEGCFIGTDPTGTVARSRVDGIGVRAVGSATVGGSSAPQRNVISGNDGAGIVDSGATIQGNFIGIDATGTVALPNAINVDTSSPAGATVIGGAAAPPGTPPGNVISGSKSHGIWFHYHYNGPETPARTVSIRGNLIGTNATGTAPIPNENHGVLIWKEPQTGGLFGPFASVGGSDPELGNVIAYNGDHGIAIRLVPTVVRSNAIHSNGGLGIDSAPEGVNPNVPRNWSNYPVLSSADSSGGATTIQGTLNSRPDWTGIRIELFSSVGCDPAGHGEGATMIGSTTVDTDANGDAFFSVVLPLSLEADSVVTSTASQPLGQSEFSACRVVTTGGPPPPLQVLSIAPTSADAAGGIPVVVVGTGFLQGASLSIGGASAEDVVVVSPTMIRATTPALPPGSLNDVSVASPSGLAQQPSAEATLPGGWMADFGDVPQGMPFHSHVEKVFRNGLTAGCGDGNYCPADPVLRDQAAVFLLKGMNSASHQPPSCVPPGTFLDVPCPGLFTDWVEQLAVEGITAGCGSNNYCPETAVTRAQLAVFLLKAEHGVDFDPPRCAGTFLDVLCPSLFANWIEQFATEGITVGCGAGNYCPDAPVTRGQMAVFLTKAFLLP